jgi:arginyl-tRNA synthetase
VGEALKERFGDTLLDAPEAEWLPQVREIATDAMMAMIRDDLLALGVRMDVFSSEKALYGTGRIEKAIERLAAQGLIYEGTLEPPKGKLPEGKKRKRGKKKEKKGKKRGGKGGRGGK